MADMFKFDFGFESTADPDVTPTGGSFEQFPAGECTINGIDSFISRDKSTDDPLFVPDNFSSDLVVRLRFRLEDGRQGPPATLNRSQLVVLVATLGGDVRDLPEGDTTKFLLEAQKRANSGGRKITVRVGEKGWVKNLNLYPPVGQYTVRFVGAHGLLSPEPVFVTNRWEKSVIRLHFIVVGNTFGKKNPYTGFRFSVELENPFEDQPDYFEDGTFRPVTRKSGNGGMMVAERRFRAFANVFLPETADGVAWSEFVWTEEKVKNPVATYCEFAQNSGKLGVVTVRLNKNARPTVDLLDLMPFEGDEPQATAAPEASLDDLVAHIERLAGMQVFIRDGSKLNMTDAGIAWMRENVAPVWDKLPGFPKNRAVAALTGEQRHLLINELSSLNTTVDEDVPF